MGASQSVDEPLRSFVAEALNRRLWVADARALRSLLRDLAVHGEGRVTVHGGDGTKTLPFELNVNARVGEAPSIARIRESFSASIKFGGGSERRAKVCVSHFDAARNSEGPHLHPFDRATGKSSGHSPHAQMISLGWFKPQSVRDAVLVALAVYFRPGDVDDAQRELQLERVPPEASALQLVV